MDIIIILSTLFNTLCFIMFATIYFKKNYRILDLETYNIMLECTEEISKKQEESTELPGGCGFFKEYIEEEEEE